SLPFRLPIDRVFTRPGFGTVVTGTLVAGTLHVGDAVEIVPQQMQTRVRGLQVHGQKTNEAEAGSRGAVNLASVETEAIERGTQEDLLETALQRAPVGIQQKDVAVASGLPSAETPAAIAGLIAAGKAVLLPADRLFHTALLNPLTDRARAVLEAYHKQ